MKLNNSPILKDKQAVYRVPQFDLSHYEDMINIRTLPIYEVKDRDIIFPATYLEDFYQEKEQGLPLFPPPGLFDYQEVMVKVGFVKERYAFFADAGLGKTLVFGELIRQIHTSTEGRIVVVVPLNILHQFEEMVLDFFADFPSFDHLHGSKMSLKEWCHYGDTRIAFVNHEAFIKEQELKDVIGFFLDECLVGDTQVDTEHGTKRIDQIQVGDYVFGAIGLQKVKAVKKRHKNLLALTSIADRYIISSINHPFFTRRGWVKAKDLKEGDYVIYTTDAMQMVQEATDGKAEEMSLSQKKSTTKQQSLLQQELLSEMENETTRDSSQSPYERCTPENWEESECLALFRQSRSKEADRADSEFESNEQLGDQEKGVEETEKNSTQTTAARRKRQGDATPTANTIRKVGRRLDRRIYPKFRQEKTWLSYPLQDRYSKPEADDSDRSRRIQPRNPHSSEEGQEKGQEITGARVDSITIYKSHDPIFTRYRDETGRVTLYDIEVENHPSFSVNGLLVHNSSILKGGIGGEGKIARNIIKASKGIRFKYAASATPAPNDRIEYAMTCLFLEYIRSEKEFYAQYFVNKDGKYVLRRHAVEKFYRYLAHWSIFIRSPKAYGFNDNLAGLKPWKEIRIPVDMTPEQLDLISRYSGKDNQTILPGIATTPSTMTQRGKYSQISKGFVYENGKVKTYTKSLKPKAITDIVQKHHGEQVIIWGVFDEEGEILLRELDELNYRVVHITGKTKPIQRIEYIDKFRHGELDIIISKPRILGFGLNFQFCRIAIYSGLSDSFEQYYQSVKRIHRYGQEKQVLIYLPYTDYEEAILTNVLSKQKQAEQDFEYQEKLYIMSLADELEQFLKMEDYTPMAKSEIQHEPIIAGDYQLYHGDSIKRMLEIREGKQLGFLLKNSVDFSIFSPPFMGDLFTYTDDPADMGNTRGAGASGGLDEFMMQFRFFLKGMKIVTKPGRLMAMHLEQVPLRKGLDGEVGFFDFRGHAIEQARQAGWIPFGEVCILKNQQMQSIVKHISTLTMSNMWKDRTRITPAFNGYLVFFKKPGENRTRIHSNLRCNCGWEGMYEEAEVIEYAPTKTTDGRTPKGGGISERHSKRHQSKGRKNPYCPDCHTALEQGDMWGDKWVRYAEGAWYEEEEEQDYNHTSNLSQQKIWDDYLKTKMGIWADISESDTLQNVFRGNKEAEDADKHLCPLPRSIARRAIELYTLPGELVFDPFAGSGTSLDQAIRLGRKAIGIELKPEYFLQAGRNLEIAISESQQLSMFGV